MTIGDSIVIASLIAAAVILIVTGHGWWVIGVVVAGFILADM